MKFTTIIVSALATLVAAAPAPTEKAVEERSVSFDSRAFSGFGGSNFAYVASLNNFNFDIIQQLALQQNFDILAFQNIFQANAQFDVANLLAFHQLQTISQLATLGVFNGIDLGGFAAGGFNLGLNGFQWGLLQGNVANFGLGSLIQGNQLNQIQAITKSLIVV